MKWLLAVFLFFSSLAQANNCADIWSQAIRSNSAVPASIAFPATPNPTLSLNMQPIDYYYPDNQDYTIGNGLVLTSNGATTKLFINGNLTIGNNAILNSNGPPQNFMLVVSGSLTLGNNAVINGFVLAGGAVQLSNNAQINGAVTAKSAVANFGVVNYRPEAIPALIGGVVCARLFANDDFESYATGSIAGLNGGTGWGGSWTGIAGRQQIIDVSSQRLQYVAANGEFIAGGRRALQLSGSNNVAATRPLPLAHRDDVVYVSMLMRFQLGAGNNKFVALWFDQTGFSNIPNIGIKTNRGSGAGAEDLFVRTLTNNDVYTMPIENGVSYLLVGRLSKSTPGAEQPYNRFELWVNPANLSEKPAVADVVSVGNSNINSFAQIGFRTANLSDTEQVTLDRVALGTSWQDVVTPSTQPTQCFFDDFERTEVGDDWAVTNKSGTFGNPRLVNGRLRMTNNSSNVATSATLQRLFPSAGNLVIVEYDFYAYGGNSADGMALVFSDADITPEPGGYGGSLGYANRCGVSGFSGGWLGLGLDTFGNYSNPTECRLGGPGSRANAIALRGSGVNQTGYRYISGTAALTPAVRTANQNISHRYRVTIDSRNPANSWVTIARDTGIGFINLIGPVDVLTSDGQAAVPAELLLTLTGSTGGSNDNHEVDNVEVCALNIQPVRRDINHFRILHSGNALTCEAAPVTILACANNSCSERFNGPVDISLLPVNGWLGGADYSQSGPAFNFSGGQLDVAIRNSSATTLTLDINSSSPTAQNVIRCFNSGVEGSCQLSFSNIGIQVDGDASIALKSPLPTQLTGKPSNIGFNAAQQRLRVVRTNTNTGACEAALQNQTLGVQFRYLLPEAAEGLNNNQMTITGASSVNLIAANNAQTVQLQFGADGSAPFVVQARDAGRYTLRADMQVPVTAPDGSVLSGTLARNDTSMPFVVRPLAVFAEASGNPIALNASGPAFIAAGDNFVLNSRTVSWQPGMDDNNDGNWDQCDLPTLAMPAISPRVPAWAVGQPVASLRAPVPGTAGNLQYSANLQFPAQTTSSNSPQLQYSEVGIVQFEAPISFLGASLQLCSANIGRFVPASFALSDLALAPYPGCAANGQHWYMRQPMQLAFSLSAQNRQGLLTRNYQDAFVRASPLLQAANAADGIDRTARLTASFSDSGWSAGRADFSIVSDGSGEPQLWFNRQSTGAADGPFSQLALGLRVLDGETPVFAGIADADMNVALAGNCSGISCNARRLAEFNLRYGRLLLENSFGPEFDELPVRLLAQYWDGNRFATNTLDNCSPIAASRLQLMPATLSPQATAAALVAGQSRNRDLYLPAPGAPGVIAAEYLVPLWLQYDWLNDGNFTDNPRAEFIFGRFRGNPRQIFWREVF
ncbi:DUF6701 domain-containing protein [Arsukibacterium sp.]|uniref:DUF6701 domain-containing protein n=1 Tax=Arsukibacterium sp. TaxID=1977258 RepID=UPI002FD90F72